MSKSPTVLVVCDGQHPWVLSVLLGCMASGIRGLTQPPNPLAPLDLFFPPYLRPAYYAALVLGAYLVAFAIWAPRSFWMSRRLWKGTRRDRLMLEQIGLWCMSMPLFVYPPAVISIFGAPIGIGGFIAFLVGIGGLARIIMIILELRALRAMTRAVKI